MAGRGASCRREPAAGSRPPGISGESVVGAPWEEREVTGAWGAGFTPHVLSELMSEGEEEIKGSETGGALPQGTARVRPGAF